jgi:subtilisin family serine protease
MLNEIEKNSKLKKRNNNNNNTFVSNSDYIYPISSVNERVVLYAYLSKELVNDIKSRDNIIDCVQNSASFTLHSYYNINDILNETQWKNVSIRENAQIHLSLLSQGKYDKNLINQYDNNYYYPSSAGKDIDIIIIDSSFHFNYDEFSNTRSRIVQCAANVKGGIVYTDNIDYYCGESEFFHGEIVADMAGGLLYGTANNANIYGISLPVGDKGVVNENDILGGLQYVYENIEYFNKPIINISIGGFHRRYDQIYKQYESLINSITNKGGTIVTASGNDKINLDNISRYLIPCEFKNTICVGGIYNPTYYEFDYIIDPNSNYGSKVDVYAPYYIFGSISLDNQSQIYITGNGTSFSAPLVSGLIATIMSDNPQKKFTLKTIKEILKENGKSEIVSTKDSTGILANNGKHIVYSTDDIYYGCGIYAGNVSCDDLSRIKIKSTKTVPSNLKMITNTNTISADTTTTTTKPPKILPNNKNGITTTLIVTTTIKFTKTLPTN